MSSEFSDLFPWQMFPLQVHGILTTIGLLDVIDILLVAAILYRVYEMLQHTRAITLVKGILILMALAVTSNFANLHVFSWLTGKLLTLLLVALPVVFQPELRRALERIGQGHFVLRSAWLNDEEAQLVVDEIARAVKNMSSTQTGALLVIERNIGLNDISATGVQIDGIITADFLQNIFVPNTPLHDGAVIVRGKRVVAAGCLLPLTENHHLSTELGTRHRAAIGVSEQCDALVVVVSEETGTISVAEEGRIMRHLDVDTLKAILRPAFVSPKETWLDIVANWRKKE